MPAAQAGWSSWVRRPIVLGLLGVVVIGVAYPPLAEPTQQPLGIFLIPILIIAALGSWSDTAWVGAAAMATALVEGALQSQFDTTGLIARLSIMGVCWLVGLVVAFERQRRQKVVDETVARGLLLDAFQDSLVPAPIPPAGVTVHTRYLPGDERLQLGGDFFDAIRLPNGSLGYVIGDVCGQGPRAAAFGAAVRSGWKTLATTAPRDPLHWVEGLDESFFRLGRHADTFVTLNTGYIELDQEHSWNFVSAGHPWPIVIGQQPTMIEPHVGPPLGVGVRAGWQTTAMTVPPDSMLMLYTDGLIENATPGRRKDNDGEGRLIDYLGGSTFDIDAMLRTFGPDGFNDDVAVMTIRFS
jgi:hypothetical protein